MDNLGLYRQLTQGAKFKNKKCLRKNDKETLNKNTPEQLVDESPQDATKIRRENHITAIGVKIPPPIRSFDELQSQYNFPAQLVNNIKSTFEVPTPIQMQAMPVLAQGRPMLACAPTGSGKTAAFLAPIINDLRAPKRVGFRALVLAPTRELAQQIYRECIRLAEKSALKVHFISKATEQLSNVFGSKNDSKKCDILISTPNRIRYLLQQEPPALDLQSVAWFVIDEADRLMEEGQDNFKEQIDDILKACSNPTLKLALFSATYTVPVAKWALRNVKNLVRIYIGQQNSATESVKQEFLFVSESGKLLAIRNMMRDGLHTPVLVFVQSKDRAKQLFEELLYDGINVGVIHADRSQKQREKCVRAFREGHIWVLICTELMSRGIDFKGVNLVINYDFPQSSISYIHRIGRTGRAGRPGKAITFFTEADKTNLKSIAQIIKQTGGEVPDFILQMKKPRKSERKMLMNIAPKREDIMTKVPPKKVKRNE